MKFKLPNNTQRLSIVGRTGSGKSQFGAWALSHAGFHSQPFVIIDYKRDKLLCAIDRAKEIGLKEIPKHPGLYIIHPTNQDDEAVEDWLWKIWNRERVGLFIDEAYMLPDKGALQAILTQGRSKRIPATILSQRPAWISRFVFSEADFYAVFHLNHVKDQQKVGEFTPNIPLWDMRVRQPPYWCRWYDVTQDASFKIQPAPSAEEILNRFDTRLRPQRKVW